MAEKATQIFNKNLSKNQIKDTGMASVLIILLISVFLQKPELVKISIVLLIIDMIIPKVFYPLAIIWIGISNLLGLIVPKIILSIVFFVIVTPIGLFRRIIGIDSLQLKKFKKDQNSVMVIRNYKFSRADIEKPY